MSANSKEMEGAGRSTIAWSATNNLNEPEDDSFIEFPERNAALQTS